MSDSHDDHASRSTKKPPTGEADAYGARTVTMKVDPALLIAAGASVAHLTGASSAEATPIAPYVLETPALHIDVVELAEDDLKAEEELAPATPLAEPVLDDPDGWDVD